ncbi:MAG: carbohydrate binding domain-containing protein [candidate division KSB1 bacterium]|nr:carbohydrate binding domain-containing protein [candidate division KSB1 bacterium]MDZ7310697.1 carbohydrate binding domain-containing protein [candidate division KSB1 bacterium]
MKKLLCFLFSVSVLFLLDANTVFAQPINPNGGFEDATPGTKTAGDVPGWTLLAEGAATATYEIIEDDVIEGKYSLRLEVGNLGSNAWDIQAVNEPFTVVPGTEYSYSVWAKADVAGPVVNFTVGSPTYTEWGRAHQIVMTTEWQKVTFRFTAPAGASGARAPIHFSESANATYLPVAFYLDDLQIIGPTSVTERESLIPYRFALGQNYPNPYGRPPFNPTTTISYSIPYLTGQNFASSATQDGQFSTIGLVTLKVYDLLGKEVATLVNERQPAGVYQVTLDAAHLSSGVYFYTLKAGSFVETKRMTLVK